MTASAFGYGLYKKDIEVRQMPQIADFSMQSMAPTLHNTLSMLKPTVLKCSSPKRWNVDEMLAKIRKIKVENPENITAKVFDEQWFRSLNATQQQRFLGCIASGVENPDSQMGCYACHADD